MARRRRRRADLRAPRRRPRSPRARDRRAPARVGRCCSRPTWSPIAPSRSSSPQEIIREQLYHQLGKELPYASRGRDRDAGGAPGGDVAIGAVIVVERESQKAIVVGKGGRRIKELGIAAREAVAELFGKPVHLALFVKVVPDWSRGDARLAKARLRRPDASEDLHLDNRWSRSSAVRTSASRRSSTASSAGAPRSSTTRPGSRAIAATATCDYFGHRAARRRHRRPRSRRRSRGRSAPASTARRCARSTRPICDARRRRDRRPHPLDHELAKQLRTTGKPFLRSTRSTAPNATLSCRFPFARPRRAVPGLRGARPRRRRDARGDRRGDLTGRPETERRCRRAMPMPTPEPTRGPDADAVDAPTRRSASRSSAGPTPASRR